MSKARITNNLPQFVGRVQQKAAGIMTQALVLGASEASVLTPIDTSTLINSQYRSVGFEGNAVVGVAGYTADYAKYVHSPNVPQTFRRATAEKEFLFKGFERNHGRIKSLFAKGLK